MVKKGIAAAKRLADGTEPEMAFKVWEWLKAGKVDPDAASWFCMGLEIGLGGHHA